MKWIMQPDVFMPMQSCPPDYCTPDKFTNPCSYEYVIVPCEPEFIEPCGAHGCAQACSLSFLCNTHQCANLACGNIPGQTYTCGEVNCAYTFTGSCSNTNCSAHAFPPVICPLQAPCITLGCGNNYICTVFA